MLMGYGSCVNQLLYIDYLENDISFVGLRKSPNSYIKSPGSCKWIVHTVQYLLRFYKRSSKLNGLDCRENSTIKHAWAKGVLGWMTSWEELVTGCNTLRWWLMLCSFCKFQFHFSTHVSIARCYAKWIIQYHDKFKVIVNNTHLKWVMH